MKLRFRTIIPLLLLLSAALPLGVAQAAAPPYMPQVFYGEVTIGGVSATDGTIVSAEIDDVEYASTTTSGGEYVLEVPGEDPAESGKQGGEPGDTVVLKVNGVVVDSHDFEQGMFTELDLVVTGPQPLTAEAGGPYSGAVGESIALSGSASGGTAPYTNYEWDLDNDAVYDDATGASPSQIWSTAGTYTIGLQVTDSDLDTDTDTTTVTVTAAGAADPWIYDTDDDNVISKTETLAAITDYMADTISMADVLAVVILYFS